MQENVITESLNYLIECGWELEQAQNLLKAIYDDDAKRLWEVAPKWIEHCGESMRYVEGMLKTVATGFVNVRMDENGEWLFSLNEKGLEVGKQLEGN